MSTRAIVGIMNDNGTILGGWQWSDGGNLGSQLRTNFRTKEEVLKLIEQGVWSVLLTPRDKELEHWKKECGTRDNYRLITVNKCYILQQPWQTNEGLVNNVDVKPYKKAMIFKNIAVAYGQDVNYVYIFNTETGKWKTFGSRYSYEYLKKFCQTTPPNQQKSIL